ncbi:MAG: O-antigen ligase family protein [Candidatus Omnitrophota bacterium]
MVTSYGIYQYAYGFNILREFLKNNSALMNYSPDFLRRLSANTIFSTFVYAPAFAGYLNMIFFSFLGYLFYLKEKPDLDKKEKAVSIFLIIYLFIIIPVLILTESKGGWFSFLFALAIFIRLGLRNHLKELIKIFILAFTAILLVGFLSFRIFPKIKFPEINNFLLSLDVRIEYWKAAINMILEKPVWGWGPGCFSFIYPLFKTKLAEETIMAHNSYLQIWAEGGIFSFTIFIWLWINFILQGIKIIHKTLTSRFILIGLYCAVISFLAHNFIDFGFYESQTALIAYALVALFFLTTNIFDPNINKDLKINNIFKTKALLTAAMLIIVFTLFYAGLKYSGEIYTFKFHQAISRNKPELALGFIRKASKLDPLNSDYVFKQALLQESLYFNKQKKLSFKSSSLPEIILLYKKAIRLNPYIAYYHFRLGEFLMQTDALANKDEALYHYIRAKEIYPLKPFYHEQIARVYDIIGNKELSAYEKSIAEYLRQFYFTGTK